MTLRASRRRDARRANKKLSRAELAHALRERTVEQITDVIESDSLYKGGTEAAKALARRCVEAFAGPG